jgi:biotin carboxyl carrier protein
LTYDIEIDGARHKLSLEPGEQADCFRATLDDETAEVDARLLQPGVLSLLIGGKSYRVILDARPMSTAVVLDERRIPYSFHDSRSLQSRGGAGAGGSGARSIIAPMPGRIVRLLVQAGDSVAAQQGLVVMEAMKMQNELKAPRAGKVVRIAAAAGATVQAGEVLLIIE